MSRARGLGRVVRAGVGRRRVQTVVVALTTLLAVTASVLAVGLLVASSAPFQTAFDHQSGAHLSAAFDARRTTPAQLATTARAAGVTAAAGPFATVTLRPRTVSQRAPGPGGIGLPPDVDLPPLTLVGRASPDGPVDRLELTAGRWPSAPGELVWSAGTVPFGVGDRFTFPGAPGSPTLTVVGLARSVTGTASAWVTPAQLTALAGPDGPGAYQMLYRFAHADTDDAVTADRAALAAAVGPGALSGAVSWRTSKLAAEKTSGTFVPFVVAFGVLGLVMSVLIVGIVVSGAVGAATRRIGILKALGFTPAQVARAYVAQALIPATVGAALGVVVGNLAAVPVLREEGDAFGTGVPRLQSWVSLVVPVGALLAVAVTALVPALRAGRLRAVDAIATGRTPVAGRGRTARRVLGHLPVPRAVSLGLGNPFTRPGRTVTIAAAVGLGALGVTFGVGLAASLAGIQAGLNQRDPGAVTVRASDPGPNPDPSSPPPVLTAESDQAVRAAIEHQPGTRRWLRTGRAAVGVAGLADSLTVITLDGDASWASYQMISGRWLAAPGEAVVPTGFLHATGKRLGDTVTLTTDRRSTSVRLVGEVLDLHENGQLIVTDERSLAGLGAVVEPDSVEYHVDLDAGVDLKSYVDSLNRTLAPLHGSAEANPGEVSGIVVAMDTLAAILTLLLIAVAGLGVLNTVVLDTRERVHDLGIYKALGLSPGQTVAMVLTSVGGTGLVAGLIGVPAGIALHDRVLPAMGRAAGTAIPAVDVDVYHPALVVALALGGLVIAIGGALLPAGWAARTRTTRALRTE